MLAPAAVSGWRPAERRGAAMPLTVIVTGTEAMSPPPGAPSSLPVIGPIPVTHRNHNLARLGRHARQVQRVICGTGYILGNGEVLTIHPLEKHADAGLRHDDWRFDAGLAPVDNRQLGASHRHGGWDDGIDLPLRYEHQRSVVRRASRYDPHGHAAQRLG